MEKEVVQAWNFNDASELQACLATALAIAQDEGFPADTVYCQNKKRMTLVKQTLTDGSHVMDLYFFDGEA